MNETYEPDIIDLNDWICGNHPDFYKATKYLSAPYGIWLKFWKEQGSPKFWE